MDFSLESFFPFDGRTLLFFTGDISSIVESASSSSSSSSSPWVASPLFCHTISPADADELQQMIKTAEDIIDMYVCPHNL